MPLATQTSERSERSDCSVAASGPGFVDQSFSVAGNQLIELRRSFGRSLPRAFFSNNLSRKCVRREGPLLITKEADGFRWKPVEETESP